MDSLKTFLDTHLIELAAVLGWIVIILPAGLYLGITWPSRRRLLFDRLTSGAIRLYYEQFFPCYTPPVDCAALETKFKEDFHKLYGRRHYIFPLLLLALVSGLGIWMTARFLQASHGLTTIKPFPAIAVSAFLGAYAWVLFDQFSRFRSGDFTSHDVYGAVYRFLISIPLGISLATFANEKVGLAVAFLLAAFPTTTILKLARRLVSKNLGVGESEEGGKLELESLQCIGRSNAERYLDEGVSTIAELAWANPIDLTIRTNREFNFVIDSISQALLWVYFTEDVKKLYPLSLRGAQEVCSLLRDLDSTTPGLRGAAQKSLKDAAAAVQLDERSFHYTLLVVTGDPYAQFLFKVWS